MVGKRSDFGWSELDFNIIFKHYRSIAVNVGLVEPLASTKFN